MNQVTSQKTVEKAKDTAGKLSGRAAAAARTAQATAGEWTGRAQESLGAVTDAAAEYARQARQKAEELGRAVGGQVQERPVSALLLAAGVGFLLGALLVRR